MLVKIAVLFVVGVAFVQAHPTSRIIGGHDAEPGRFPYQISLQYGYRLNILHQHVCGGSILNKRWILTAGHCITEVPHFPLAGYYVKAGVHNLHEAGQLVQVKRTIVHEDYKGGVNPNDIALVELETDLILGDHVAPVELPKQDEIPTGEAVLSGWGLTKNQHGIIPVFPPNDLQTVDMPVLSYEECKQALENLAGTSNPLKDTNTCTGPIDKEGISACSGDSGGPLVSKDNGQAKQIGVVSWGMMPCGTKGAPSVFTRVSAFVDWINQHINN